MDELVVVSLVKLGLGDGPLLGILQLLMVSSVHHFRWRCHSLLRQLLFEWLLLDDVLSVALCGSLRLRIGCHTSSKQSLRVLRLLGYKWVSLLLDRLILLIEVHLELGLRVMVVLLLVSHLILALQLLLAL